MERLTYPALSTAGGTLTGSLTLSSGQFLAPDGTAAAPSYSFSAETGTGLYRPGVNTLGITTGGSNTFAFSTGSNFNLYGSSAAIRFGPSQDLQLTRSGTANNADLNIKQYTAPPTAASAALAAGAGIDDGAHSYIISFGTAGGWTGTPTVAATSNVVTHGAGNNQTNLTNIPVGNQFVTQRKIFRNSVAIPGTWKLIATLPNNTATTYTDAASDASIFAAEAITTTNTALDTRATVNNAGQLLVSGGTGAFPAFAWAEDNDGSGTGSYRIAANMLGWAANGIAGMLFNSAQLQLKSTYLLGFSSGAVDGSTASDIYLNRAGAANPQWGQNSATPIAQQHNMAPSVTAGGATTDTAGANATFQSGNGVGTGGSGSIIFKTAPAAGTGNAANTMAAALTIVPTGIITNKLVATAAAAPTIASATTIAPITAIAFVSGITTIQTITPPSPISLGGGQITLIPTGLFLTGVTGNIALASTSVVSKALIMTYDVTTTKWYPSY